MRLPAAILTALFLLVLAGCGGQPSSAGDFEGEERAVAEVVEDLQTAGQRGEGDTICTTILAKALRDRITATGLDCDEEMRKAIEDADAFDLDVQKVTVTGTKATAVVRGDNGDAPDIQRTFSFEKEAGVWRATSFGASG